MAGTPSATAVDEDVALAFTGSRPSTTGAARRISPATSDDEGSVNVHPSRKPARFSTSDPDFAHILSRRLEKVAALDAANGHSPAGSVSGRTGPTVSFASTPQTPTTPGTPSDRGSRPASNSSRSSKRGSRFLRKNPRSLLSLIGLKGVASVQDEVTSAVQQDMAVDNASRLRKSNSGIKEAFSAPPRAAPTTAVAPTRGMHKSNSAPALSASFSSMGYPAAAGYPSAAGYNTMESDSTTVHSSDAVLAAKRFAVIAAWNHQKSKGNGYMNLPSGRPRTGNQSDLCLISSPRPLSPSGSCAKVEVPWAPLGTFHNDIGYSRSLSMPDGPRRRRAVSSTGASAASTPLTPLSPATPSRIPREGRGHFELPVPSGMPPRLTYPADDQLQAECGEPWSGLRIAGNSQGFGKMSSAAF